MNKYVTFCATCPYFGAEEGKTIKPLSCPTIGGGAVQMGNENSLSVNYEKTKCKRGYKTEVKNCRMQNDSYAHKYEVSFECDKEAAMRDSKVSPSYMAYEDFLSVLEVAPVKIKGRGFFGAQGIQRHNYNAEEEVYLTLAKEIYHD